MNAINWKKLLLPNIPYLLFVYAELAIFAADEV